MIKAWWVIIAFALFYIHDTQMTNKDIAHNIFFLHFCYEITLKVDDTSFNCFEHFS